jgi:hypothetical protein
MDISSDGFKPPHNPIEYGMNYIQIHPKDTDSMFELSLSVKTIVQQVGSLE